MIPAHESPMTAVDLFSGAGGFSLGLHSAGVDVVSAVEIDPNLASTYRRNFPNTNLLVRDIRSVTGQDLSGKNGIDLVVGGPPCQGFSIGGTRNPRDARNTLLTEFSRLVREIGPKYFLMENVPGLLEKPFAPALDALRKSLEAGGYCVFPPVVLNARDFGIPQERRRIFLLGTSVDSRRDDINPLANINVLDPIPTVWDAIKDLAFVSGERHKESQSRYFKKTPEKISGYARVLRLAEPPNGCAAPDHQIGCTILNHRVTAHSPQVIERFRGTARGTMEPISRYYRLHPDREARTLRAGTGADHGSHTSPRPIHPYAPRCITVREAARLHSFPDWFEFNETTWHGFRQIGNAVPPQMAERIVRSVLVAPMGSVSSEDFGENGIVSEEAPVVF